jgi:stage II sporulation protein R
LREDLKNLKDVNQAKAYLQENLPKIQAVANRVLRETGCEDRATVQLCMEEFSKREYDTFSLPAGIYESLRIIIGNGTGQNWWCVVFPEFCLPAASEGFAETAACAGFSDSLTAALEGKEGYEIRFFLLDVLGQLENLLHRV